MPSTITHAYIGLDTLNKLNDNPKRIIKKRIDNYKIYCQNMDVLYFYHIFLLVHNKISDLGHEFHHKNVFDSFNLLINDNKENKDLELFTFISGLITHYIADSSIHPYINYLSRANNKTAKFNDHFEIETYIDNYFIKNKEHVDQKKYDNSRLIFNYTESKIIKDELNKLYSELFNYQNMGSKYYRSLKEMKFVYRFVRYDKYGIKRLIFRIIDLNPFKNIPRVKYLSYHFDVDNDDHFLNLNHEKWFNIDDHNITSTKSFLDLYQDVTNEASYIINELYEYIFNEKQVNIKKLIKNNSYATGLSLSPNK